MPRTPILLLEVRLLKHPLSRVKYLALRRNELQRPKGAFERSRTAKRVRRSEVILRLLAAGMFIWMGTCLDKNRTI